MIAVEISVAGHGEEPLALLVRAPGLGDIGVEVAPADLADLLTALVQAPVGRGEGGLHAVTAQAGLGEEAVDGAPVLLRLVVELSRDADGSTRASVRRVDRPVDVGPLALHDLPDVIQALAGAAAAEVSPPSER